MIKIFDNIIPLAEQEEIKNHLYGRHFPWYYTNDITNPDENFQGRPGFSHMFFIDGVNNSPENLRYIKNISDEVNKKIKKNLLMHTVRTFLQLPLNENILFKDKNKHIEDTPHLDLDCPHTVFLYYVNDADGDTLIYDYKSTNIEDRPLYDDINVVERVTPKQGRVIVFDGMTWHSSTQPTKGRRTVINFDMVSHLTL